MIAVLGGISAHRMVAGADGAGWWPELVGPGLGVDTRQYRVLGIDYLGGRGDSSTPQDGGKFPPLSSYDQADALCAIVRHLGLKSLHAIVGASYGGMVALCFAERYAELVGHIVVLSAADKSQVLSTAWRSVQRQIVREAIARGDGRGGTEARARAGDGDLSQRRGISAALRRRRRRAMRIGFDFRSKSTCSPAATTTCRSTAPNRFSS